MKVITYSTMANTYLVIDEETKKGFIVDPGAYYAELSGRVIDEGADIMYIILTHGHADHIGGVESYKNDFPSVKVVAAEAERQMLLDPEANLSLEITGNAVSIEADIYVKEGDHLTVGNMEIEYTVDPGIVRGLDYYTKTAFEFVAKGLGAQSTVCGGGRYDDLSEELGGPPIPGVGFGLGIERLLITMEENGFEIPAPSGADAFIVFVGDRAKKVAMKLMRELRLKGLHVEMDDMARNVKGQFKYADRLGARNTVVIGDDEIDKKMVTIKDMSTSQQRVVSIDDLDKELLNKEIR